LRGTLIRALAELLLGYISIMWQNSERP